MYFSEVMWYYLSAKIRALNSTINSFVLLLKDLYLEQQQIKSVARNNRIRELYIMYYIAICDDEEVFLESLKGSLEKILKEKSVDAEIYVCRNGIELEKLYNIRQPNVVFLDIDMPGKDGFQIAELIKEKYKETMIVFCTNHNELVFDSFEYQPFWFLCKDDYKERLNAVLDRLHVKVESNTAEFILKSNEGLLRIKYKDIVYVEVHKHKLQIHLIQDIVECRKNLSDIEAQFLKNNFLKINSGCIVNLDYVYKLKDNLLILNTEEILIISRSRKTIVKNAFFKYLEGE